MQESKNFINLMVKTFVKDKSTQSEKSTTLSEESLLQIIKKLDTNGDGALQKDEIMDAIDEIVFIILEQKRTKTKTNSKIKNRKHGPNRFNGTLKLKVVSAELKGLSAKINPYCEVLFNHRKHKSETLKNISKRATWNYEVSLNVYNYYNTITFTICDAKDTCHPDTGRVFRASVNSLISEGPKTYALQKGGSIKIETEWMQGVNSSTFDHELVGRGC